METISSKDIPVLNNTVVTIGAFDGIHLGHQAILKVVAADARSIQGKSVLLTFCGHPRQVLRGEEIGLITTPEQRTEILSRMKVDYTVVIDDERIFDYTPERFIDVFLSRKLKAKEVVVGFNFRFGKGQVGDSELLKTRGVLLDFKVKVIEPVQIGSEIVSSTSIRKLLLEGRVDQANTCLGRPYEIRGTVEKGEGRGKQLGFPTANLQTDVVPLIGYGVYSALVRTPESSGPIKKPLRSLVSYGTNPTFNSVLTDPAPSLEVYIPDFEGNLYGQKLHLQFIRKTRSEKKFKNESELVKAIKEDLDKTPRLLPQAPL